MEKTAMKDRGDNLRASQTRAGQGGSFPGVVSIQELYTLEEAKRRLRWTDSSMRSARRRGLRLLSSGKRKYVSGREILRFLEQESGLE